MSDRTVISIEGPLFYGQEDEDVFFACIYQLPTYKNVRGHLRMLDIEFEAEPTDQDILQLLSICRRWEIDTNPLEEHRSGSNSEHILWKKKVARENT